ncbi:SH3 domain-containing protein [Paraburkholderia sp.]|uniref:SH3 domain-containing protein n=1 Tax=Paraburkholderia sp. TaxID=1926495 RepID=UPI003D6FFFE7
MHRWLIGGALMAALGAATWSGTASAQSQAYTNVPVNVRAGPAPDYPVVAQLPGGASVSVMGCVSGYTWCDVAVPGLRGWVYGGSLNYPYQGATVPLMSYGPTIGLPIVVFSLNTYWGSYYRNRPWYRDRSRWMNRPPPRPGRPPVHGGGRPPGQGNARPPGPRPQPGQGAGRPGRPGGPSAGGQRPGGPGAQPGGGRPGGQGNARPPGGGNNGGNRGGNNGGSRGSGGRGGPPPRN